MSNAILHDHLPKAPWLDPAVWRLPGVQPLALDDWLVRDEVFGAQMALRDQLIEEKPGDVLALLPSAKEAAQECLDLILKALGNDPAYAIEDEKVTRPDGVTVLLDSDHPMLTIGRLQQADVCLMQEGPSGHLLTGAALCFPAYWTLAEKIGKPLGPIHAPVAEYDASLEKRVQRLFDAMRPDQLLWRANAILHDDPSLFSPWPETEKHARRAEKPARFVRSERQTLRKMPVSGAVIFTIHTYMISLDRLTERQRDAIACTALKLG